MSVIYMNGFEWNSLGENLTAYNTTGVALQSKADGDHVKSGDYSCMLSSSGFGAGWIETTFDTAFSEFYLQFAMYLDAAWTTTAIKILHWKYNTAIIGTLVFDGPSQLLKVYSGDTTGTLRLTTSYMLIQDRWYYIELHVKISDTVGVYEVKVDGTSVGSFNGDTQPGVDYEINRIRFASTPTVGTNTWWYVDDIVINDTTGTVNNSWVDCLAVQLIRPWGTGSSERWEKYSTTALNNYECVDGAPVADPTEYLYTEYGGKEDLYLIEDLPVDVYSISAIRADAWACKTSGSSRDLSVAIKSGATTYISTTHELNIYYTLYGSYWEQNPAGATYWSVADINNLEAGMQSSF